MPLGPGPSPGRFRCVFFWQLSLWCLNSGRCSTRRADEIAEGAAWDWPSGAFLRFGNDSELIYTRITTSAGLTISDLQITVPVAECREWNASDLGPYTLLIHMHDVSYLELLLHITADENSTLFLGPSLDDGYEITLASEQGISSVRRLLANRVQGSTEEQGLWALPGARLSVRLSWQLLLGAGTLRIYNGSEPLPATQLLAFVDPTPPRRASDLRLWAATTSTAGLWSACPVGRSAPVLERENHQRPMLKLVRDGTRPSECEETLQDVAVPSSEWQSWPLPLVLTENRLEALENFSFMQGMDSSDADVDKKAPEPKKIKLEPKDENMTQPDGEGDIPPPPIDHQAAFGQHQVFDLTLDDELRDTEPPPQPEHHAGGAFPTLTRPSWTDARSGEAEEEVRNMFRAADAEALIDQLSGPSGRTNFLRVSLAFPENASLPRKRQIQKELLDKLKAMKCSSGIDGQNGADLWIQKDRPLEERLRIRAVVLTKNFYNKIPSLAGRPPLPPPEMVWRGQVFIGQTKLIRNMDDGHEPIATDQIIEDNKGNHTVWFLSSQAFEEVTGRAKETLQQAWLDYGPASTPMGAGGAL
ncbi:Eno2 [Symbiodinium sp. CCMP2592]|nr:Eno2 [Symbiodinium sp. CCMP2592]